MVTYPSIHKEKCVERVNRNECECSFLLQNYEILGGDSKGESHEKTR